MRWAVILCLILGVSFTDLPFDLVATDTVGHRRAEEDTRIDCSRDDNSCRLLSVEESEPGDVGRVALAP